MKINNNVSSMGNNNNNLNRNQNNNTNNNNIAFKGSFTDKVVYAAKNPKKSLADLFTLKREGPMSRNLFIANAFVFLLGTRFITSRDNNERRETLVRDVPSIVLAVQGVPMFQNWAAGKIQNMTGFAFMNDAKKSSEGTASYGQLESWYKYNDKLHSGFDGFCKRLSTQGGDLKKIFSYLGDNIKQDLSGDKFAGKTNEELVEELESNSKLKTKIITALKDEKNNALKQASFLKTTSAVIGYGVTLGLLGIFIPKLNIAITEGLNKNKKVNEQNKPEAQANELPKPQSFKANETKKVFENISGNN